MPPALQQVFVALLADLHDAYRQLDWPTYSGGQSARAAHQPDEDQLAFVGYVADLDADGGLIFRTPPSSRSRTRTPPGCWPGDDPIRPLRAGRSSAPADDGLTHPPEPARIRRCRERGRGGNRSGRTVVS